VIAAIVALPAGCCALGFLGNLGGSAMRPVALPPKPAEPDKPIEEIDAASLAVAFHDRSGDAAQGYALKTIDLVVPVDAVSQNGQTGTITCLSSFNTRIECTFGRSGLAGLSPIQRGQLVTVRGTCMGKTGGTIYLGGCQIRAVHGNGKKYF
jgi:hypothetical protein